jgi:hypothetical protein
MFFTSTRHRKFFLTIHNITKIFSCALVFDRSTSVACSVWPPDDEIQLLLLRKNIRPVPVLFATTCVYSTSAEFLFWLMSVEMYCRNSLSTYHRHANLHVVKTMHDRGVLGKQPAREFAKIKCLWSLFCSSIALLLVSQNKSDHRA